MFSSLASFLFGSNTSATTTGEANDNQPIQANEQQPPQLSNNNINQDAVPIENAHTIEVTSSTPSVTGALGSSTFGLHQGKRGKNKRNKQAQKSKCSRVNASAGASHKRPSPTSLAKLLTPNDSLHEDIDEDDWYIVEKEDEDESLPRTDSEEEMSVAEVKQKLQATGVVGPSSSGGAAAAHRRRLHNNSHSLYSGPRPQQQRNSMQRARNIGARLTGPLSVSTLSYTTLTNLTGLPSTPTIRNGLADGGITQSLYVVSTSSGAAQQSRNEHNAGGLDNHLGANSSLDESWYVTPPPCFSSNGPIHMEFSPFENLLIEHPSMSVYHSIRSAQEAIDCLVHLDLGVNDTQIKNETAVAVPSAREQQQGDVQERAGGRVRIDQSAAQLKQELLARASQKHRDRHERQKLCRSALQRANAVRDYQSKGNRQRRSDMQHCKVNSGANNNRKCCF